jgi:hypothetical protein
MLTGGRPMTMFAVRANVGPGQSEAAERRVREFLLDSWRNYRAVCQR